MKTKAQHVEEVVPAQEEVLPGEVAERNAPGTRRPARTCDGSLPVFRVPVKPLTPQATQALHVPAESPPPNQISYQ
ncbi:MAG: hypothetical protein WBD63_09455 [Phycisphaerae bacterium]|jgi:hypothetical protein|nr:hypothetical protein [Phycisphaerae bacterium]